MSQVGDDCYFFYSATCIKGPACPFRHVEEARGSEVECPLWRQGRCFQPKCPYRHAEIVKNRHMIPCYYESQPGGCTKPHCPFLHTQPQLNVPPPSFTGPPPTRPQVSGPHQVPPQALGPPPQSQPPGPAPLPVVSGPPPVIQTVRPHGIPAMGPPPPHMWRGPAPQGPPVFQHMPPGPRLPMFRPEVEGVRLVMVPRVDPVIVNFNSEESESDGSPVKPIRVVAPHIRKSMSDTTLIHQEASGGGMAEHNPLDYFLGAKPWVDPNSHEWDNRRSPSPTGRQQSPIGFQARRIGSVSPVRSRGSLSPDRDRRRSTSEERRVRPADRRRSHSLDRSRSQSPDWRDWPRGRGRSPVRPRSRSPAGRKPFRGPAVRRSPPRRFGRSYQRPQDRRPRRSPGKEKPPAQPVIIPKGPKIISTKKERKEEDKKEKEEGEKKEVTEESKEEETGEVPPTEVRSLEDIYREKALKSLMEAKKKKVIENRRQKLAERAKQVKSEHPELVKSDKLEEEKSDGEKSEKSSSSDKEQTSESESEASGDEKEAHSSEEGGAKAGGGSKVESANGEEKVESDIDLEDDVDIELEAGDKGSDDNSGSEKSDENEEEHSGSEAQKSDSSEKKQTVTEARKKIPKTSIKSRLGMKSDVRAINRREALKDRLGLNAPKPSIKDRLGKREDVTEKSTVRSGVIKLNRGRPRNIPDAFEDVRTSRIGRNNDYGREKDLMMVPKIVVRNRLEDFDPEYEHSRESSRSRHGYDDYADSNSDYSHESDSDDDIIAKLSKRKKKLKKMLESEGSDYDEIELLKREKRKIKKLLKRKKDKKGKRRKERRKRERKETAYSEEEGEAEEEERHKRRIKIQSRLGPAKEESDKSEDEEKDHNEEEEEIRLSEEDQVELEEGKKNEEKQVEEREELTEAEIEARERLRQEKAQRLQEALQPKTLEDIRRERMKNKVLEPRVGLKEKRTEGSGRRILLAEEKEPSPPKQQVRITFNEDAKPPVRQRIRLKRDTEQNENKVPASNMIKTFKRERQIYLPPGRKRTDEPDSEPAIKRTVTDREIVDYGELFPSTRPDTAKEAASEVPKTTTIQLIRSERKPPPKVEIENAGIKSFAEIMAEKKRKRLLAQQETKKNITPIVFEDRPDSGSSITSKLTPDLRSRLSPVEESLSSGTKSHSNPSELSTMPLKISQKSVPSSSAKNSAINSSVKTDTSGVKPSTNVQSSHPRTSSPVTNPVGHKRTIPPTKSLVKELSTQKPNRWKRRKANAGNEDSVSVSSSGESLTTKTYESASGIPKLAEEITLSPVPATSEKERRTSTGSEKKSAKASDSLMDFEDELLADVDLNLDDEKSHDELMREMEELLA